MLTAIALQISMVTLEFGSGTGSLPSEVNRRTLQCGFGFTQPAEVALTMPLSQCPDT